MDGTKSKYCYKEITICGVVQGVGFRPFVSRLASRFGISGSVRNRGGSVDIHMCGTAEAMSLFMHELEINPPFGSWIADIRMRDSVPFEADGFIIEQSGDYSGDAAFVSPDIAVCADCLAEIRDERNRRYKHPFNSCVACGPRYSIIKKLPYDRENTSMRKFSMCGECGRAYANTQNRRCHAQTVCCNDCGPGLRLRQRDADELCGSEAFDQSVSILKGGGIIAMKGIGGYHFACLPENRKAVMELRGLKSRDAKPFAVMLRDLDAVRKICEISPEEERLLTSPARPITLLEMKNPVFADGLLNGDNRCGCFLPYTALHQMLLDELEAIVLTSANFGGSAVITEDSEALSFFGESDSPLFAGVLYHDREILHAVEDSVVQAVGGRVQILRRARGYAPSAIPVQSRSGNAILAMGGDLKAAFCLVKGGFAYQSPYFGDLAEKSVYDRFRLSMSELCGLLDIRPSHVTCDMHPGYFSAALAEAWSLPVTQIQHHHAHIASVMAEHSLYQKVIGVAFDGTGYGEDGTIWGGEFLVCEGASFRRAGHLGYVRFPGGDSPAKDARNSAFCYLWDDGSIESEQMGAREQILSAALKSGVDTVESSSMGRLFDAVSAILGLGTVNSYEGECAVLLQRCAENALKERKRTHPLRFAVKNESGCLIADGVAMAQDIFHAKRHVDTGSLALGFHEAVADLTLDICVRLRDREGCGTVALSGGVFQNRLLLEMTLERLERAKFDVYINNMFPPNDGGISLGQAYIGGLLPCV